MDKRTTESAEAALVTQYSKELEGISEKQKNCKAFLKAAPKRISEVKAKIKKLNKILGLTAEIAK